MPCQPRGSGPASRGGRPAATAAGSRPGLAVRGSVSSRPPPWISALQQRRSRHAGQGSAWLPLALPCPLERRENPFHRPKGAFVSRHVWASAAEQGPVFIPSGIKNPGSFWAPGPFVLRDDFVWGFAANSWFQTQISVVPFL